MSKAFLGNPYLQIHFCVLLWGFTAILGRLITLSTIPLVFWRVVIVTVCMLMWPAIWRQLPRIAPRDLGLAMLNGLVITMHWLCFYGAIKAANASVAATCLALSPVFLAIIEPLWRQRRFSPADLAIGAIALPGVALVVNGIPTGMYVGLGYGIMAALLVAVFGMISKSLSMRAPALPLTTVQIATGAVFLGLLIPFWPLLGSEFALPDRQDFVWLLILAILCTVVPFTLNMVALRRISAFSAQLALNLEPVYSIILATLLLGEANELNGPFYLGVALIVGGVLWHAATNKPESSAGAAVP